MTSKLKFAVLSGGSGTRLWPLSRKMFPKQFYALGGSQKPLLIESVERLEKLGAEVHVITTSDLKNSTMGLVKRFHKNVEYLWEPSARNTAPAIALFTAQALKEDPETILGVFPADHVVQKAQAFQDAIQVAIAEAKKGAVVTLGIQPSFAADAYGYMELAGETNAATPRPQKVMRFIEKPSVYRAEALIATGKVVWNAGIFVFKAKTMAEAFAQHMPALWNSVQKIDLTNEKSFADTYAKLPKESIDYGVMEQLSDIICVPADLGWTDLGSWEEVAKFKTAGDEIRVGSSESFYLNQSRQTKQAVFVGVSDTIVVDTDDAILVMQRGMGQQVRDAVKILEAKDSPLVDQHRFEERPWGRFDILFESAYCKSKRISVAAGQKLSYQSHKFRQEQWTIVKGVAHVTLNDVVHELKAGESIFIPQGAKHRIANQGSEDMEFIEVQTGSYFGEDDIVRYSDDYGRN